MKLQVSDVLVNMRSRLNDTDSSKYRWSDEELIDMINSSLANLSRRLFLFTHEEIVTIQEDTSTMGSGMINRYPLPNNCIRVIAININNQLATIKSFEWMSKNKNHIDHDNYFACMDEQSFFLYPKELLLKDMKVEVTYNFIEQINTKKDNIPISLSAKNALTFYAMHLAHQITTSKESKGKSIYYLRLYDKEIEQIKELYYKNRHSKRLRSPFKKV